MSLPNTAITTLASHTSTDASTVRRWATGGSVHGTTRQRLERGARELGIEIPQSAAPAPASSGPTPPRAA